MSDYLDDVSNWHLRGRKVVDMDRDELIEFIVYLAGEVKAERDSYKRLSGYMKTNPELKKALQDITALIQEASNGGRVDELLYLANSADPLILDRTWIQNRIRELTNSGGSNNG